MTDRVLDLTDALKKSVRILQIVYQANTLEQAKRCKGGSSFGLLWRRAFSEKASQFSLMDSKCFSFSSPTGPTQRKGRRDVESNLFTDQSACNVLCKQHVTQVNKKRFKLACIYCQYLKLTRAVKQLNHYCSISGFKDRIFFTNLLRGNHRFS